MTKSSRFGGLSANIQQKAAPAVQAVPDTELAEALPAAAARTKGRVGKKVIAGHFSEDLSRQLRTLAASEGTSVQSLMGEAFDLLMRARGKHPFGER